MELNNMNQKVFTVSKKEILMDRENNISSEKYAAEKESLRESDNVRYDSLSQMRTWIQQNPDIENCLTDDNFLLRFLRVRKFSIPMAQQTLLKYLNFRQKFRQSFYNLDYTNHRTTELIDKKYIYVSPYRDCNGRRVIIYDFRNADPHEYTILEMQRAHFVTYETLLDDEECQIMGVTHVVHAGGIGPSFIPIMLTKEFGSLIKWGEQSFPMRHKALLVTNVSSNIKFMYEIGKNLISQKLQNRLWLDESVDKLLQKVDKRCLPQELGGTIPAKDMITLWKEELAAKRERLLSFDNMHLLSERRIITRKNRPKLDETGCGSLSGSFRRLDID